jgi:hypothetical protein
MPKFDQKHIAKALLRQKIEEHFSRISNNFIEK